jgi:hypothetical protein
MTSSDREINECILTLCSLVPDAAPVLTPCLADELGLMSLLYPLPFVSYAAEILMYYRFVRVYVFLP